MQSGLLISKQACIRLNNVFPERNRSLANTIQIGNALQYRRLTWNDSPIISQLIIRNILPIMTNGNRKDIPQIKYRTPGSYPDVRKTKARLHLNCIPGELIQTEAKK